MVTSLSDIRKKQEASNDYFLQTHKQLDESERRYRLLFEKSQDPILLLDPENDCFVEYNTAALKILGLLGAKEVVSLKPEDLSPRFQPDGELSSEKARKYIVEARENGYARFEWQHMNLDGQRFYVEVSLTLVPIKQKEFLFTQWRLIDELKQTLFELDLAKKHAEKSDRLKNIFLANMSHELRTPLNSVIGFSNLLLEGDVDREHQYYASIINSNGEQLLHIVEDLFDIAMLEEGRFEVNCKRTEIGTDFFLSLHKTIKGELQRMNKKSVHVTFVPDPDCQQFVIHTDRFRLVQVLLNLLRNSAKFTYSGNIVFGYKIIDNYVEFYVEDTGVGIPASKIDMVVEPFRQVSESVTMNEGGVGLGLSLSNRIVKMLGGELNLSSVEGQGTIVQFTIPYNEEVEESGSEPAIKKPSSLEHRNILIAEDESDNYLLLKTFLEKQGAKCVWARDGIEAVEKIGGRKDWDLVLMDIKMPRLDGYKAFRQIRKIESKLKVIATTAFAMSGDENSLMEFGFDSYISKPIDFKRLDAVVKELLVDRGLNGSVDD